MIDLGKNQIEGGRFRYEIVSPSNEIREKSDWQSNLITDQGMNLWINPGYQVGQPTYNANVLTSGGYLGMQQGAGFYTTAQGYGAPNTQIYMFIGEHKGKNFFKSDPEREYHYYGLATASTNAFDVILSTGMFPQNITGKEIVFPNGTRSIITSYVNPRKIQVQDQLAVASYENFKIFDTGNFISGYYSGGFFYTTAPFVAAVSSSIKGRIKTDDGYEFLITGISSSTQIGVKEVCKKYGQIMATTTPLQTFTYWATNYEFIDQSNNRARFQATLFMGDQNGYYCGQSKPTPNTFKTWFSREFQPETVSTGKRYYECGVQFYNQTTSQHLIPFSRLLINDGSGFYIQQGERLRLTYELNFKCAATGLFTGKLDITGWPISGQLNTNYSGYILYNDFGIYSNNNGDQGEYGCPLGCKRPTGGSNDYATAGYFSRHYNVYGLARSGLFDLAGVQNFKFSQRYDMNTKVGYDYIGAYGGGSSSWTYPNSWQPTNNFGYTDQNFPEWTLVHGNSIPEFMGNAISRNGGIKSIALSYIYNYDYFNPDSVPMVVLDLEYPQFKDEFTRVDYTFLRGWERNLINSKPIYLPIISGTYQV